MNKILIIPTWRCQLQCAYCGIHTAESGQPGYDLSFFGFDRHIGKELKASDWLFALRKYKPYHLEITGGEPTIYPGIEELVRNLPTDCSWAITSNTLNTEIIRQLKFRQCVCWTASYHYRDTDVFLGNLAYIKSLNIVEPHVTCTFTPENIEYATEAVRMIQGKGYKVNVHRMVSRDNPWLACPDKWKQAEQIRGINLVTSISDVWKPEPHVSCPAGTVNYFCCTPDGTLFRCHSEIGLGQPIGNIKDFQPARLSYPCSSGCLFPCDKDIPKW